MYAQSRAAIATWQTMPKAAAAKAGALDDGALSEERSALHAALAGAVPVPGADITAVTWIPVRMVEELAAVAAEPLAPAADAAGEPPEAEAEGEVELCSSGLMEHLLDSPHRPSTREPRAVAAPAPAAPRCAPPP